MKDIFISYRREDGEAVAYLIYKDLTKLGYSVFFDHKTLGSGDFMENIENTIAGCKDVIIILSSSSFSERIFQENDVFRFEIETALKQKKRIVGIMLESFPGFPDSLPDSIDIIRNVNCIKLYLAYYEGMFERLTSGMFLSSVPATDSVSVSNVAVNSAIPEQLRSLSKLTAEQKNDCMKLLLTIMDNFNQSDRIMNVYNYIDIFDRYKGKMDIPDYSGVIPTDFATYLSFFETLYIVVASKTIELSVIDYAYRFRFFAGCNSPAIQNSELLPLGYQYPNIISFYNMWGDYIVEHFDHNSECDSLSDEIPLYEYDLHKRYAAYCFSNNPRIPMNMRALNRRMEWKNLIIKHITPDDIELSMKLQNDVLSRIRDNEKVNFFEPLSEDEMLRSINNGVCIGLYDNDKLVAQLNLLTNPEDEENLALDLDSEQYSKEAAVVDYVMVDETARGFGLQRILLFMAECIAKNYNKPALVAVTSPQNVQSIKNFISQDYKIVATLPKYKSERHYLWKEID